MPFKFAYSNNSTSLKDFEGLATFESFTAYVTIVCNHSNPCKTPISSLVN